MKLILDLLWTRSWWIYQPTGNIPSEVYHYFNLFEAMAWILLAILVLVRYLHRRSSTWEIAYAFAFLLFGLSDIREAYELNSWLIWAKGLNLAVLLLLRRMIQSRYYPESQLY